MPWMKSRREGMGLALIIKDYHRHRQRYEISTGDEACSRHKQRCRGRYIEVRDLRCRDWRQVDCVATAWGKIAKGKRRRVIY
jgi:hypothetical protein